MEQLQRQVEVDPLTGLYNFRRFKEALAQEVERTARTGLPTSLVMIDLDHFKRVNDTYGHQIGNEALKMASLVFQTSTRIIDVPCRYGGEEFAIILPGTDLPGAVRAAERLRSVLEASRLPLESGGELSLTASFGVASTDQAQDPEALIALADSYLLAAKERGRNRVEHPPLTPLDTGITVEEQEALWGELEDLDELEDP